MPSLDLINKKSNKPGKIPPAAVLIALLGGIFLFLGSFFHYYHRDQIDNVISEQISFYSHWRSQKLDMDNDVIKKGLALVSGLGFDDVTEKITNSKEFAIFNLDGQWIFAFVPKKQSADVFNAQYVYKNIVFESLQNQAGISELIDEEESLAASDFYRHAKYTDTSLINVFIPSFKNLDFLPAELTEENLPVNFFGKAQPEADELKMTAKDSESLENCDNNLVLSDSKEMKYYINNLSTQNFALKNLIFLNNLNNCIDLAVDKNDNWLIIAKNDVQKLLQDNISSYLSEKYPKIVERILPDNTIAKHMLASNDDLWQRSDEMGMLNAGNDFERFYIREVNTGFLLSNNRELIAEHSSDLSFADTSKNPESQIVINNPDIFLFSSISITESNQKIDISIH
ncbi:MAG TPA: hypothetical protein VMX18_03980 [Candidatus Bipolaricaulota bacterium]|nr:hypothetical protein [Candidatus Bipolaricaulota bacterium]